MAAGKRQRMIVVLGRNGPMERGLLVVQRHQIVQRGQHPGEGELVLHPGATLGDGQGAAQRTQAVDDTVTMTTNATVHSGHTPSSE